MNVHKVVECRFEKGSFGVCFVGSCSFRRLDCTVIALAYT